MKKPNLFIVGAGRSGTTSLYEWFKGHPDVFLSEVKGPNFFGEEPNPEFPQFFKNEKKYLSLFVSGDNKKILGEASHYFWSTTAPKEIKEFNLNSKILIILRNPIDIALSYYKSGTIPNNIPFEESIELKDKSLEIMWEKLRFSRNLKNYLNVFEPKNIHIIIFDDLKDNSKKVYLDICKFLDINQDYIPSFEVHNKSRELKNKWLLYFLSITPIKLRLFFKSLISEHAVKKIRKSIIKFTTKKEINQSIDAETRDKLNKMFKDEILKTSKIVGRDLTYWTS